MKFCFWRELHNSVPTVSSDGSELCLTPYKGLLHFQSSCVHGIYATHSGVLYLHAASGLSLLESQIFVFVIPAQWKDCLKVDLAEAQPEVVKETACFYITQDLLLIFFFSSGTCHFSGG